MGLFNFLKRNKKQAVVAQGGLEAAANYTKDRSIIWAATPEETMNPTPATRRQVLSTARYMVANYALAERILSVSEIYGIGGGIIANAATPDNDYNEAATNTFDEWASGVFCSSNNQYNFYEMQKIIVRELLLAGEVFIVLEKTALGFPQLRLVASEQVSHSGSKDDTSVDGLFVNEFGRVTAYNIAVGKGYQKIDAGNVIHLMRHKQIGQLRGLSCFTASLNSLRDHRDLVVLEKKAVKTHSMLAVAVTRGNAQAGDGFTGDLVPQENTAGSSAIGLEKALGGANVVLAPGEKIDLLTSNRSTEGFHNFLEMLMRDVALNLSIPYEFLVNAEKLTGTGVRFALSDAAFFFSGLQTLITDGALQRIYTYVVASFIKGGKLAAPKSGRFWAVSWGYPVSITVDQGRVDNAAIASLQNSLLTYDSYWSARGKNWKDQLRQRAREEQFLNEVAEETGVDVNRLRTLAAGSPAMEPVTETDVVMPAEEQKAA